METVSLVLCRMVCSIEVLLVDVSEVYETSVALILACLLASGLLLDVAN